MTLYDTRLLQRIEALLSVIPGERPSQMLMISTFYPTVWVVPRMKDIENIISEEKQSRQTAATPY
jgi:hypothetical protein